MSPQGRLSPLAGRFEAVVISAATANSTCDDELVPIITVISVVAITAVPPKQRAVVGREESHPLKLCITSGNGPFNGTA